MYYELCNIIFVDELCDVKLSECERMCVRENESECEREGVNVSRLKWGASGKRESVINYLMFDFNSKFIVECIFLLPVKAALHNGELYIIVTTHS